MAVRDLTLLTAADFDNFIADHVGDEIYEFVDGQLLQVPGNPWVSSIAATLIFYVMLHMRQFEIAGRVSAEAGGFMVNGQRFAPDLAYVGPDKRFVDSGYNPDPPDLAVEIVSNERNTAELHGLQIKLQHYRAAGVIVWVVLPRAQRVEIHDPAAHISQGPVTLGPDDTLTGPAFLPGFRLPLGEIFSE